MVNYTSTSEKNIKYPEITTKASIIDEIFKNFKQNKDYNEILEHVTQNQGQQYITYLNEDFKNKISLFKKNDLLGNPKKYYYNNYGEFSPTTLRYVKVLQDLNDNFILEGSSVVEIGCGYGGQYVVMKQLFNPKKYTFVDLPNVLPLINRYLTELNLNDNTILVNGKDSTYTYEKKYDLVISNYGISECNKEVQDFYIKNIINKSEHGYITHNQFNGYSLDDFVKKIDKDLEITTEKPITGRKNVIIKW